MRKHWLLDTNAVIALLKNTHSKLAGRLKRHDPGDIHTSSIVMYELFYGASKSQRIAHNTAIIDSLQFDVIDFDNEDARAAGQIRAFLAKKGISIGPYDTLIAGQAMARDMIVVTRNTKEFTRIPGLCHEDWES